VAEPGPWFRGCINISFLTHLNIYPWSSFQVYGMFMPKIAVTREYKDRQTVPELRKSSNCMSVERFSKHILPKIYILQHTDRRHAWCRNIKGT
jgi:hypothetical protein